MERVLKSVFFKIIVFALLLSAAPLISMATGDITCEFYSGTSCPGDTVKLIGVQNESGGFNNAHAQNMSVGTYAYSICCNNTNASITIGTGCDGATVIRLSDETNAHAQIGNTTGYPVAACLNTSYMNITCTYPDGPCSSGCVMTLSNSEGPDDSNAHVGNCSQYTKSVCCGFSNNPPSAPVLNYPADENTTVFERRPMLNWSASSDPEGNVITYVVNASCGAACSCADTYQAGISLTNYTPASDLCVDVNYNWTVTACDVYNACNQSEQWNFTIQSVLDFVLIVNSTDFNQMTIGEYNDTIDDSPPPMVGRNNGNILLNATINSTGLFGTVAMNTLYYRFMASDSESGSITAGCSQTEFANMDTAEKDLFCYLGHNDSNDEVRIDFNITVPVSEGPGAKNGAIEVTCVPGE